MHTVRTTARGSLDPIIDHVMFGALTAAIAMAPMLGHVALRALYVAVVLCGAAAGAVTGMIASELSRARVDRGRSVLAGTLLGFVWGGATGLLAALAAFFGTPFLGTAILLGFGIGSISGAFQFAWVIPVWLSRHRRGASTWPVMVGAVVVAAGIAGVVAHVAR